MPTPTAFHDAAGQTRALQISQGLKALGIRLPVPPRPVGCYQAVVVRHGIGAVSGQFPLSEGRLVYPGVVGAELSPEQGHAAARLAALNVLAQIEAALGGFGRFGGLLRLEGYVSSAPGFIDQPAVLDGASALFIAVLGETLGAHTRTALAVPQLPLGAAVELAVTFAVNDQR